MNHYFLGGPRHGERHYGAPSRYFDVPFKRTELKVEWEPYADFCINSGKFTYEIVGEFEGNYIWAPANAPWMDVQSLIVGALFKEADEKEYLKEKIRAFGEQF